MGGAVLLDDRFEGSTLDEAKWFPHYPARLAEVRRCPRPPTYPMQLMLAVFDFPEWSVGDDDHLVPELNVRRVAVTS